MNSFKRKALSFLLIFSLFVGIVGIVNVDTTYAATKKIHIESTTLTLLVGGVGDQQSLINKDGKVIKATKIKWRSANTSVATIDKKGIITPLKIGTAKMTAKYKGKTYKFTVKVISWLEGLHNVINRKGYKNSNGDKELQYVIKTNDRTKSTVFFIDHGNTIQFINYLDLTAEIGSFASFYTSMEMELPESSMVIPTIRYDLINDNCNVHAYVIPSEYNSTDELFFYKDSGNLPLDEGNKKVLNKVFQLAMLNWDKGLSEVGYNRMNRLGFDNF